MTCPLRSARLPDSTVAHTLGGLLLSCLWLGCEQPPPPSVDPRKPDANEATDKARPPVAQRPTAQPRKSLRSSLATLRNTGSTQFVATSPQGAKGFGRWVNHLGSALAGRQLPTQPPPEGFSGHFVERGQIWLLSETLGLNTGSGALALRVEADSSLIVEVPHTFFDSYTLPVGLAVFEETSARALLINTIHRGGLGSEAQRLDRVRGGNSPADVAHQVNSYFHQAHRELTELYADSVVVQLHGYRDEKVPRCKIIVSAAGTSANIAPLARALNDALGPGTAALYPGEVSQLGGTTNAQAAASRQAGTAFIHLELAASLRARLNRQPTLLQRFAAAIKLGTSAR